MKEIKVKELCNVIDPMAMEQEWAIAVASDGTETNGLTIGWASFGILWGKPASTVYVHKDRYSKHIFDVAKYYSICFVKDREQLKYFGTVSGKDENKMERCGMTVINDVAPYFAESEVVVFCRVMGKSEFDVNSVDGGVLEWYRRDGVHTQYYGEIVKVLVKE